MKAVSDLFSPVTGEVTERNEEAVKSPELVNQDPYGRGWLVRLSLSDAGEVDKLLTAAQYEKLVAEAQGKCGRFAARHKTTLQPQMGTDPPAGRHRLGPNRVRQPGNLCFICVNLWPSNARA